MCNHSNITKRRTRKILANSLRKLFTKWKSLIGKKGGIRWTTRISGCNYKRRRSRKKVDWNNGVSESQQTLSDLVFKTIFHFAVEKKNNLW